MAFVVEDGTVVTGSNSYVDLTFADDYFAIDVEFDSTWDGYADAVKEQYLQWATRILDQKVQWKGDKTDETSSLRWPRTGVTDRDGVSIDTDEMPLQLKQATCELVKFLTTNDPTTSQGVDYLKRVAVDVIEIEYQDGAGQVSAPPILNQLLRGLGYYPVPMGHSFGRIVKT